MKMNENVIDLIYELKKKCVKSDIQFAVDLKINQSEYNFVQFLTGSNKMTCKAIAEKMNLSTSRVSRIIDNMVKKGFLTRTYPENDRRNININLTEKGILLKKEILKFKKECEQKITESLSESEQASVNYYLKKIIELL